MYRNFFQTFKKTFTSNTKSVYPDRFINYFLKPDYYTYKDNTGLIEKVFDNNFTELILSPNNYGKTFNMETLKYFLSCNFLIDERVDRDQRLNFFSKTEIYNQEFFKQHFAKYPVIYINFKELDQTNYIDNLEKFKFLVSLQYEQILQFLQSKDHKENLNQIDIKNIEEFFSNYKSFNENHLFNSCKDLSKLLLKATRQNPFIIIDDYDFPLINSYRNGFYEDALTFMQSFINITIKNNNFLNKTIITGVNLIEEKQLFSQINNVIIKNYDDAENNNYAPYFKHHSTESSNTALEKHLNLKKIFESVLSDANGNYLNGMKVISDLKIKSENILNDIIENNKTNNEVIPYESLEFQSLTISNAVKNNPSFLYSYLHYNGLMDKHYKITNKYFARIIKESLPALENPYDLNFDSDRKYSFAYYYYLNNGKVDSYLDHVKNILDCATKASKNTLMSNIKPEFNISFRNEKEFEEYLIDKFTLDMDNENSDGIKVLSINDDENDIKKIKDELKTFTLITYEKKHFAVFLKGSKYKKPKETGIMSNINESTNAGLEIDELLNNPNLNINQATKVSKKRTGFAKKAVGINTTDIPTELKKINEQVMGSIDKQEAIDFLFKISTDFDTVFFVSVSNYQKQIDYLLEIVNLEQE